MKRLLRFVSPTFARLNSAATGAANRLAKRRLSVITFGLVGLVGLVMFMQPSTPATAAAPVSGLQTYIFHNSNNTDSSYYWGSASNATTWFEDKGYANANMTMTTTDIGNVWSASQYYNTNNTAKTYNASDVSSLEYYSALFLGYIKPTTTQTNFQLEICSDDSSALFFGSAAATGSSFSMANATINNNYIQGVTCRTSNNLGTLSPGTYYPLRAEFGEWGGGDQVNIAYSTNGGSTWSNLPTNWIYNQGATVTNNSTTPTINTPTLTTGTDTGASNTDGVTGANTLTFTGSETMGGSSNATVTIYSTGSSSATTGGTSVGTATVTSSGTYNVNVTGYAGADTFYYATIATSDGLYTVATPGSKEVKGNFLTVSTPAGGAKDGVALARQPVIATTDGSTPGTVTATPSVGTASAGSTATGSSGSATFSGLTLSYSSASLAGASITYSASNYFNVTQTALTGLPTNLQINTGTSDANGVWLGNTWYTSSTSTSVITPTDLATQLNTASSNLYSFGNINVMANATSTTSGNGLKLAANGYITMGAKITTNAGAVTVLANVDNGSGASAGNITIMAAGGITTAGANITLAGGDWNTTTGYARGYSTAAGATTLASGATYNASTYTDSADDAGIWLAGSLSSGGGAITLNGQEGTGTGDSSGVYLTAGSSTAAAGGNITVTGILGTDQTDTVQSHRGLRIGSGSATPKPSVTTTGSGTITLSGTSTSTSIRPQATLFENASISSVNGNISINASTNSANDRGVYFVTALSTVTTTGTGSISFTSNTSTNGDDLSQLSANSGGTLAVNSDKYAVGASTALASAGLMTIQPVSTSFSSTVTVPSTATLTPSAGLVLGKSGNTAGLTITGALTVTGNLTTYAGATSVSASSAVSTSSSGNIAINVAGSNSFTNSSSVTAAGTLNITAASVTTSAALQSASTMSVVASAGDVSLAGNVKTTASGSTLTLKATGNVISTAAITYQTNGGNLIQWADSDASGAGYVTIWGGSTVSTDNGANSSSSTTTGKIYVAGGLDNNSDGLPDGYSVSTSSTFCGIESGYGGTNATVTNFYSGNGNIYFNGKSTSGTDGTCFDYGTSMFANGGTLNLNGLATTTGLGLQLARNPATTATSNFVSNSSTSPAISMNGTSAAAWGFLSAYNRTAANNVYIQATGSGGIAIAGQTAGATTSGYGDINLNSTNVLSASGQISLNSNSASTTAGGILIGGNTSTNYSESPSTFGSCAVATCPASLVTSTSANFAAVTDAWYGYNNSAVAAVPSQFNTSGNVSITPKANTGFALMNTALMNMATTVGAITLGTDQSTNNTTWALNTSWNVVGPVSLYGGTVTVSSNVTLTGAGKKFLVKTPADANTGSNVIIVTNNAPIVFWANSDKLAGVPSSGRIGIGSSTTLNSQGGPIYLGGGLDDGGVDAGITSAKGGWSSMTAGDGFPDGYAVGENVANQDSGILLATGYSILSGGGDVYMAAMDSPTNPNSGTSAEFIASSGTIDSGSGRIGLWGKASAMSSGIWNYGLMLHGYNADGVDAGSVWTSANTTAGAITIYGDSSANTSLYAYGVYAQNYSPLTTQWGYNSFHLLATGAKVAGDAVNNPGGGINVTGISGTNTATQGGGITWSWADALAKDGAINLSGYSADAAGSFLSAGIYLGVNNSVANDRFGAASTLNNTTAKTYTNAAGVVTDFTTSNSNITLTATKFVFYEFASDPGLSGYRFNTSGDVTLQSWGSSFTSDQNTTHWQFGRIWMLGNPRNVTIGKPTDTSNYNWYYTIAATGSIKFYANRIFFYNGSVGNTLLSTTLGASGTATPNTGVLIKVADRIFFQNSVGVQTAGSDITMWSDSDNDGVGAQYYELNNTFKSNGGKITMAAGLDDGTATNSEFTGRTAGDGYPDGYASGVSGWGQNAGIDILTGYQILSGGGDIFIAGRGSAAAGDDDYGVSLRGGLIYSGTGKIAIYGKAPASCVNNWHRGIVTTWAGDGGTADSIISDSTSASAITMYGDMSSCSGGTNVYANAIEGYYSSGTNVATPYNGGINIIAKQGNASYGAGTWGTDAQESSGVCLNYYNLLSPSGPISVTTTLTGTKPTYYAVRWNCRGTGQTNNVGASTAAINTGFTAYSSINITSSTSNVTVTGDSIVPQSVFFRNTGNLTLQPQSASFDRNQSFSSAWGVSFPATYSNVLMGKAGTSGADQNSASFDVDKIAATGDISLYGGTVQVNGGLTTSESTGNGILVKATQDVVSKDGASGARIPITITGSASTVPIYLWANSDASGTGSVKIGNYNDMTSQGGPIYLGGSTAATDTAPTTYAINDSTTHPSGVELGTNSGINGNVTITSNGGNITIRGKTTNDGAASMGVLAWGGQTISSGTGAIVIDAYSNGASGTNNGHGVEFNYGSATATSIISAKTSGTAISISGAEGASTSSNNARGIVNWSGSSTLNITASGGGDINLTGTAGSNTAQAISLNGTNIYAAGGNITLNGGTKQIDIGQDGVAQTDSFGGSAANSKANAVTFKADSILLPTYATAFQNANSLYFISNSSSFNGAQTFGSGMSVSNIGYMDVGLSTNTAAITVSGTNSVAGNIDIYGGAVMVSGNQTTTNSGNINVAATGAYSGAGALTSAGNTTISSTAFSGTGAVTASGSGGISITSTAGDSAITTNLTTNTSSSAPIVVRASGNITVSASKALTTACLLYTSPSPRDGLLSRMPSSA